MRRQRYRAQGSPRNGGLQPPGQVRLVDLPARDRITDGFDPGFERWPVEVRDELQALGHVRGGVLFGTSPRTDRGQALPNRGEASCEPLAVAVDGTTAEPGAAGPPIPCHDPVVQPEPQQRQSLVVPGQCRAEARRQDRGHTRDSRRARRGTAADLPRSRRGSSPGSAASRPSSRRAVANTSGPSDGASRSATGSAHRNVQRERRPGRALSSRAKPGWPRNASATSIGARAAISAGNSSRLTRAPDRGTERRVEGAWITRR